MLEDIFRDEHGRATALHRNIAFTDHLPQVFRARMRQLEAVHRWLAGYFQAASILLQIPGGARYEWIDPGGLEIDSVCLANSEAEAAGLLVYLLKQLDSSHLLSQVPMIAKIRRQAPPAELVQRLRNANRDLCLVIVAMCLDRLLVQPHLDQGEKAGHGAEPRKKKSKKKST